MEVYSERNMKLDDLLVIAPAFPDRLDQNIAGIFIKQQIKYLKAFLKIYVAPSTIWPDYILGKKQEPYSWDNVQVYYPLIANFPSPMFPPCLKISSMLNPLNLISEIDQKIYLVNLSIF